MLGFLRLSEYRCRFQSSDSSCEDQNVFLHLSLDVGLRGSWVFTQELRDAQDTLFLRPKQSREITVSISWQRHTQRPLQAAARYLVTGQFVLVGEPVEQLPADLDRRHRRHKLPVLLSLRAQPTQQRHLQDKTGLFKSLVFQIKCECKSNLVAFLLTTQVSFYA